MSSGDTNKCDCFSYCLLKRVNIGKTCITQRPRFSKWLHRTWVKVHSTRQTDFMGRSNLVPGATWQVTFKKMPLVVSENSVHSCAKTLLNVPPSSKHGAVWSWVSAACHEDWMWTQPGQPAAFLPRGGAAPLTGFFWGAGREVKNSVF